MRITRLRAIALTGALAVVFALMPSGSPGAQGLVGPSLATGLQAVLDQDGTTRGNAACPGEDVAFDPGQGEDVVLPRGYKIEAFATNLNFPTSIAFLRNGGRDDFQVLAVESGTGLPGRCNNNENPVWGGKLSAGNPFTP